MQTSLSNDAFKKITVVFWALWWLIALWTDVVGGLAQLGWLQASWAPNLNYPFLAESLKMYNVAPWVVDFLFVGIIVWSLVVTAFFVRAACSIKKSRAVWLRRSQTAFIIAITYWMTFFLADQMIMKFDLEENHMVQGGFLLMTYLAFILFPDK
jgi:hypothetical protein